MRTDQDGLYGFVYTYRVDDLALPRTAVQELVVVGGELQDTPNVTQESDGEIVGSVPAAEFGVERIPEPDEREPMQITGTRIANGVIHVQRFPQPETPEGESSGQEGSGQEGSGQEGSEQEGAEGQSPEDLQNSEAPQGSQTSPTTSATAASTAEAIPRLRGPRHRRSHPRPRRPALPPCGRPHDRAGPVSHGPRQYERSGHRGRSRGEPRERPGSSVSPMVPAPPPTPVRVRPTPQPTVAAGRAWSVRLWCRSRSS